MKCSINWLFIRIIYSYNNKSLDIRMDTIKMDAIRMDAIKMDAIKM